MSNGLPLVPPPGAPTTEKAVPAPAKKKEKPEPKPAPPKRVKTSHLPEETLTREVCSLRLSIDGLTMELSMLRAYLMQEKK